MAATAWRCSTKNRAKIPPCILRKDSSTLSEPRIGDFAIQVAASPLLAWRVDTPIIRLVTLLNGCIARAYVRRSRSSSSGGNSEWRPLTLLSPLRRTCGHFRRSILGVLHGLFKNNPLPALSRLGVESPWPGLAGRPGLREGRPLPSQRTHVLRLRGLSDEGQSSPAVPYPLRTRTRARPRTLLYPNTWHASAQAARRYPNVPARYRSAQELDCVESCLVHPRGLP